MTTKKTLATLLGLLLAGSLSMATAACGDTGAANPDSGADAASQTEGAADASLFETHGRLQKALDAAMEEWEEASEALEALKAPAGQVAENTGK